MVPDKRKYNNQPNIITGTREELSLIEKRIVYLVINQLHTQEYIQGTVFQDEEYSIRAADLGSNTVQIRKALSKLRSRGRIMNENEDHAKEITPFPKFDYSKKDGIITIELDKEAVPYFKELKMGYTKYQLAAALSLSSVYAQKLYENLSRWADRKSRTWLLVDLQFTLNASNYKYAKFKQACLDVAHKEINEKTDLMFSWYPVKTGRMVTSIRFEIESKEMNQKQENHDTVQQEVQAISNLSQGDIAYYAKQLMHNYKFTKTQQTQLMTDRPLFEKFAELDSKIVNGVIVPKDPTRYIASILFKPKS